jgi:hypothetical protein
MHSNRISGLLAPGSRFLRSAHLDRDFYDSTALAGYILTDFTRDCLGRMAIGLKPNSGQRAWRVTGDYGSGKSSFALMFAHWLAGDDSKFPPEIRKATAFHQFGVPRPQFVPTLVTCSRRPLGVSILKSLQHTLGNVYKNGKSAKHASKIQRCVESKYEPTEDEIFELIQGVNAQIIADNKGEGLLLVIDELGKFLEFAAAYPNREDVYFLQRLAEAASRSGEQPLFVVCLLHQGFYAYADHLNPAVQREWEKVAARFEEIVFNQPVDQIAQVISSALNVKTRDLPRPLASELKLLMKRTLSLGWFGSSPKRSMLEIASRLYPLHPIVLPVLIRAFRRFAQNERSLFSFLLSNEPFGLQAFAERQVQGEVFRLHDFYDYIRTNFGHRLAVQSYRSHWNLIDSIVESFATEDPLQIKVLKTVGILNLLNDSDLLPTEESVLCALVGSDDADETSIRTAVEKLHKRKRVLYDRGPGRGLCLWPHTSVDLEHAYEKARGTIDSSQRVAILIEDFLETRPIVARRHYIETGNLRHYEVRYCAVAELASTLEQDAAQSDGVIIVSLCETLEERNAALAFVGHRRLKEHPHWLLAVPQPLRNLASLVQEVQRWEWVSANTLELNADKFAREEVSRQKAAAQSQLERRIQSYVGLNQFRGQMMLDWFCRGEPLGIRDGRELLKVLSDIFDQTYHESPCIQNELVNRRSLSSAAAAARMRLIKLIFTSGHLERLGLNPAKKPPEMSMYLSVLRNTGLHREVQGSWCIGEPHHQTDARCRLLPTFRRIREILKQRPDSRVNVVALVDELRKPPYGVRDGLIPIFLAVFAIAHEKDVAFYKDGTFVRQLDGEAMLLLTKAPERFDIQYCKIEGMRAEVFQRLLAVLEIKTKDRRNFELLDVVKMLCVFVAQLPTYVLNTKKLPPVALAVRNTILDAREPARLLFTDLPKACGFEPIVPNSRATEGIVAFVKTLKSALDELRAAYPEMQERLRGRLREAFDLPGTFQQFRTALAARLEKVLLGIAEPKLRAFCLRLFDENLPELDWLESIGSYLALKPPSKWHDAEEDLFNNELAACAMRLRHVESIVFANGGSSGNSIGVRLAITQSNGLEHEEILYYAADEERRMGELQSEFEGILIEHGRLALAAASRAIWTSLEKRRKSQR